MNSTRFLFLALSQLLFACAEMPTPTTPAPTETPDAATPPLAPTNLSAVPGDGEVTLTWSLSAGALSYRLYRSTEAGTRGAPVGDPAGGTFQDTTVTNGTTYFYEVTALNAAGESAASSQTAATPQAAQLPGVPMNVVATPGDGRVELTWAPSAAASSYAIFRSSMSGSQGTMLGTSTTPGFTDTQAMNGNTYFYEVIARNQTGDSAPSAQISATPLALPMAPDPLVAKGRDGEVALTWTAVAGATSYRAYRSQTAGQRGQVVLTTMHPVIVAADATVTNGVTYYYEVTALNASGGESPATTQKAATPRLLRTPRLTVDSTGDSQVSLSWNTVAQATSYAVYRSQVSGSAGTLVGSPTATTFVDSGLSNGTRYFFTVVALATNGDSDPSEEVRAVPQTSRWGQTLTAGASNSYFVGTALDSQGNVYAAGWQKGTSTFEYGNGVSATGPAPQNPVLVKYDATGVAQWARTLTAAPSTGFGSQFAAVAVDGAGNVYAAGHVSVGTVDFGNNVRVTTGSANSNVVVVKYDSSGVPQWARSTTSSAGNAGFSSIAIDAMGNLYLAGFETAITNNSYVVINGLFDFGNGVTTSALTRWGDALLVKYDASGQAQWARTVTSATAASGFNAVAVDTVGNVVVGGFQSGTATFSYGNSVSGTGTYDGANATLVKYDASGAAQWAMVATGGNSTSEVTGLTVDPTGIVAVGFQYGNGAFSYGAVSLTGGAFQRNLVIARFTDLGVAVWARTAIGPADTRLNAITRDASGNLLAVGSASGGVTLNFGGVSARGPGTHRNAMVVRYDADGIAEWVQFGSGGNDCAFEGVVTDATGNLFAVGHQFYASTYSYGSGNNVSLTGPSANTTGSNATLVSFR